jgi:hypothetical protein
MRAILGSIAALAIVSGAVAFCAVASAQAAPTEVLGVPIPDHVQGLPHLPPEDFESRSPGMGYGIRFLRPDWAIDIYIYDLGIKSIPDDPTSPEVQKALDEAKGEITELEQRGNYSGVTVKTEFTVRDSVGQARFVCVEYNYYHKGRATELDSYLCLAGVKNEFFNIRMDRPTDANSFAEARSFVRAWTDVLWPSR